MQISNFPFKAVLWDMDGTLIDSEPIWIAEERKLMDSLGATWSDDDALYCIGGPKNRVDAYMRSKLPMDRRGEFEELALSKILFETMARRLGSQIPFAPGAKDLIDQMEQMQIPMALVTASTREIMDAALASIAGGYFRTTISDHDVERPKPDPQGYLLAASRIGVAIEECLVIEDSITGAAAAISSGAYLLGITRSGPLPEGEKVRHVKSLIALDLSGIVQLFQPLLVENR
ncbi:MAG: HAD family phosphatase [Actinobacteria bacterium]|nr:HAD family phosphatase [Actinomycetota bacterium]